MPASAMSADCSRMAAPQRRGVGVLGGRCATVRAGLPVTCSTGGGRDHGGLVGGSAANWMPNWTWSSG